MIPVEVLVQSEPVQGVAIFTVIVWEGSIPHVIVYVRVDVIEPSRPTVS